MEQSEYIEQRNGGFYIAGTRLSLDSIVYSFKSGNLPETIRQNFSSLERARHEIVLQDLAKH